MGVTLDPVINFGKVTVSTGYNAAATTIVLSGGEGAKLPASFSYNLIWWNATDFPDPTDDPNVEIVRVSNRSTDILTITRGQEGSAATTKNEVSKTYKMILAITKKMIDDINSHTSDDNQAHTDYLKNNAADVGVALTLQNSTSVPLTLNNQTGTQDILDLQDNSSTVMVVKDGGNVGIGITPTQPLTINAGRGDTINDVPLKCIRNTQTTDQDASALIFLMDTDGDMSDGFGGRFRFHLQDAGGGIENHVGSFGFVRDGADSQGKFFIANQTDAASLASFVVDTLGRIGINTISPAREANVVADNNAISGTNVDVSSLGLGINRATNDNEAVGLGFGHSSDLTNIGAAIIHERTGGNSQGKLHFATKAATTVASDIPIRMTIDENGITWWRGSAGLIFGSMHVASELIVPISTANPTEVKDSGNDGWTAGELNLVIFPTGGDEHYLTIPKAGRYEIVWNISAHIAIGGTSAIHGGLMINGVAQRNCGEAHRDVVNQNDTGNMGAPCIIDLPNGTEQISLWVINDQSNDLHIIHSTIVLKLIGGT